MKSKVMRIAVVFILVTFISGFVISDASAQNPIRKLGRGIGNVLSGFLELPLSIVDTAEEEGYLAAMTYGVTKGVAMSILRTGVGLYETVTFLIPLPWGYEPILEPEFLMSEENF